jgi:hypothetical protein
LFHQPSQSFRAIPITKEYIGPDRAIDGATGILGKQQPLVERAFSI